MIEEGIINANLESQSSIIGNLTNLPLINANIEGKGDPGPQGIPGITYIPEIENVNTLEPDQNASASVKTEKNKMLFTFNIPKGAQGPGDMSKSIYDTNNDGIVDKAHHSINSDNSQKAQEAEKASLLGDLSAEDIIKLIKLATNPIGSVQAYAGINAPNGWLICDGSEISRTEFSDLFNVIGVTFGSGDGSTTFNIPNISKKTIIGRCDEDEKYLNIGNLVGDETHTLTIEELAEHDHEATASSNGSHAHNTWNTFSFNHASGNVTTRSTGDSSDGRGNATDAAGLHSHTILIGKTGNNKPFSIVQPSLVMNYIIKC